MNKTRNLKKVLSLVLVLMMVVSTMMIMPLTTSALDGVDGSGTQEDPYVLSNAAECNTLKSNVGSLTSPVYVELDADISGFTGAFVGSNWGTGYTYVWHIDGQGHTMSGLTTKLLGGCAAGSTISNLTIANSQITLNESNSGAWVAYGAADFTNCVMAADVTIDGAGNAHVGGFVGSLSNAATFTDCVNNATVAGNQNVGGFVGATGKNVTFTNCVNNGVANGGRTASETRGTGGFIGTQEGGTVTLTNCVNNGEIISSAAYPAGGLVGYRKAGTLNFTACTNNGAVTSASNYAGGIVGYNGADGLTIDKCMNTGAVTSDSSMAGGMVGRGANAGTMTITNSRNEGAITGSLQTGGAVGLAQKVVNIQNFVNAGTVTCVGTAVGSDTAIATAGGLVGGMWPGGNTTDKLTVTNAINEGTVSAPGTHNAAAFVGQAKHGLVTLNDCYNVGLIERNLIGTSSAATVNVLNTATLAETYAIIAQPNAITAENTSAAWDGSSVETPDLLDPALANSAENPYIIDTAEKLAWFSAHNASFDLGVDGEGAAITAYYAKLTKNIDLGKMTWLGMKTNYTPEGGSATNISVYIDGDNYTIQNATFSTTTDYYNGFFVSTTAATNANVAGNITLTNLHFNGLVQPAISNRNEGFLAHTLSGTMTLTNVTLGSSCIMLLSRNNGYMHGLVGELVSGGKLIADRCVVAANIASTGTSACNSKYGGYVGRVNSGATLTLTNVVAEVGFGRQLTGHASNGAIVGQLNATSGVTMTNVFASGGLTNVYSAGVGPSFTNCYDTFETLNPANATAIETIKKMGVTATVGADQGVRLKLTDDFGFMPIYATGAEKFNPHVTYGIKVGSEFVAGEYYYNADGSVSFCVPFEDVSVAKMDQDVTFTPAIMVNGVQVATGASKTVNIYKLAKAIYEGHGTIYGNNPESSEDDAWVTDDLEEIALYGAMATYCEKYNAYVGDIPQ